MKPPVSPELTEFVIRNALVYYGRSDRISITSWQNILSAEEKARAKRMQDEQHRQTFITTRVALRSLLGNLLSLPPDQVMIQINPAGKPFLPDSTLDFSISHTRNSFLIGFNPDGLIGVDMEILTGSENLPDIVDFAFSEKERQHCDSGKDAKKFLEIWTTKEGMLKLTGRGMVDDLKGFCTFNEDLSDILAVRQLFTAPGGETCCVLLKTGRSANESIDQYLSG